MKKRLTSTSKNSRPKKRSITRGKLAMKYIVLGAIAFLIIPVLGYFIRGAQNIPLKDSDLAGDPFLQKHYAAMDNVKELREKTIYDDKKEEIFVYEMEQIGEFEDDNYNSSDWIEINGKRTEEAIIIGEIMYEKDYTDNKWWEHATEKSEPYMPYDEPIDMHEADTSDKRQKVDIYDQPKKIGEEPCPNSTSLTCYIYEEFNKLGRKVLKTTMWIDTKEYLLRKRMYDDSSQEFEYENIDIKAPLLIKEIAAEEEKNPIFYLMTPKEKDSN